MLALSWDDSCGKVQSCVWKYRWKGAAQPYVLSTLASVNAVASAFESIIFFALLFPFLSFPSWLLFPFLLSFLLLPVWAHQLTDLTGVSLQSRLCCFISSTNPPPSAATTISVLVMLKSFPQNSLLKSKRLLHAALNSLVHFSSAVLLVLTIGYSR